jgi:hypothetical protein
MNESSYQIMAELPIGEIHPKMHISTLENYAKRQARYGRPVRPYPDGLEKKIYKPLIKMFKRNINKPFTLDDLYLRLRGSVDIHPHTQVAVMLAIAEMGKKGLVQYLTIKIKTHEAQHIMIEGKIEEVGISRWNERTAFRYIKQKPGPPRGWAPLRSLKEAKGPLAYASIRMKAQANERKNERNRP